MKEHIIATMTSWTKRITNIPIVMGTLLNQTIMPNKIVLNLSIDEFKNKEKDLPLQVTNFLEENKELIYINWLSGKNIRSWKKTLPTFNLFPNDVIINTNEKIDNVIEEIDKQIETKANQTDLDIERSRIDNFTTLQEGSTTGDAELIDGRVGVYGITYTNIGSAIRLQIKNILDTFNSIINGGYSPIILDYTEGGYIDSNGKVVQYDNHHNSDFRIQLHCLQEIY